MKWIDLHVHSTCSDGTLTPTQLVAHAADCGLSAFALTDHDCTDGIETALQAAAGLLEVIPGIELSTEYSGQDIHIVGLEPDWQDSAFQSQLSRFRDERLQRNLKMMKRMNADGISISYAQMEEAFGEQVWTRAHFARYLMEHGYVQTMQEAFDTCISEGCKYYVPREKISPCEAVALIRRFHGIPILAHPLQYALEDDALRALIRSLCKCGLIGMEVFYSTYTPEQQSYLQSLAEEFGLLPSGGSDFHGANKPSIALGSGCNNLQIPYDVLQALRNRKTC